MGLLGWALIFLVVALIAALFGFTNLAAGAMAIARVLFGIFLFLFLLLLIFSFLGVCAVTVTP